MFSNLWYVERGWLAILKLAKGYQITNISGINEGFEIQEYVIFANINAYKQAKVIEHFICIQEEPLFFILEVPTNELVELEIGNGVIEQLHKDIYYMDDCTKQEA